ncbi:MAG TPA: lipase maturation factor family protein [Candidatus Bilamarchaeum sp.]|nr:lipase maturation factor family protein [Candidatus Bilamarchaeum sp.]
MLDQIGAALQSAWQPDQHILAQTLFIQLMGAIYVLAFWSLLIQAKGLWGRNGILPADFLLAQLKRAGIRRFYYLPTLFWLNSSDAALILACLAGMAFGTLLALGIAPLAMLILLYALYLSFKSIGQDFLNFQWDALLLEVGFASIFAAAAPSGITALLLWFVLFKFMFMAGAVKLTSRDPAWRGLSAMAFHYQTQPLPNPLSWYAHNLPMWYHRLSVIGMFFIENVSPFLIFGTWETRLLAFALLVLLQFMIFMTGNYGPFNLISMVMCVPLLPDSLLSGLPIAQIAPAVPEIFVIPPCILLIIMSGINLLTLSKREVPGTSLLRLAEPFEISNGYGIFAVMTTKRYEIIVEWSMDGKKWTEYGFRWKPQAPARHPPVSAPHMPRLDWLMWFLPFSSFEYNGWFQRFLEKLLKNSPDVTGLLSSAPQDPPKFVRALAYDYRFTTPRERKKTGNLWVRTLVGSYSPPLTARDF